MFVSLEVFWLMSATQNWAGSYLCKNQLDRCAKRQRLRGSTKTTMLSMTVFSSLPLGRPWKKAALLHTYKDGFTLSNRTTVVCLLNDFGCLAIYKTRTVAIGKRSIGNPPSLDSVATLKVHGITYIWNA